MHLSSTTFIRLLGALEELAAQESIQLAGGDYAAIRRTQERAAPLVAELVRLGGSAVTPVARPRLEALLARREHNQGQLSLRIAEAREALCQSQANRRRVAQIAPAYGSPSKGKAQRSIGRTHAVA